MFEYVYLDHSKKLVDIRLKDEINKFNFHDSMEDLGIINYVLILCWELNISFIEINKVIGQIQFNNNYQNYQITLSSDLKSDNFIQLSNNTIRLVYNSESINVDSSFTIGFLNWKHKKSPMHKAKIRCDIITSKALDTKKQDILKNISDNSFVVLGSETSNGFKLFVPDIYSKNELKYMTILETNQPQVIIKPKTMTTRSYCLIIYSWDGSLYKPSYSIYLSGSPNNYDVKLADTEFQSILYNCLPTPKISNDELKKISEYYQLNDSNYRDFKSKAIAIDPPGSKDKDDAISFNIIKNKGHPVAIEMFVHISDVPPVLNTSYNKYLFYYSFHKLETDYMLGTRYPMIDPKLSESTNSLSLIGPNKRAFTVKITYRIKPGGKYLFEIPDKVEMYLEKNIKIFATTYESIATELTDYSKDLPVNNDYVVHHKLKYNGNPVSSLNPIPCADKPIDITKIKWENEYDDSDLSYLKTQLEQLTWIYKMFVRSLPIVLDIKPLLQTKQYFNDDYHYGLREEWVHRLIEITAIETNKYVALILFDKISNETFGITNKFIGKLTMKQIKDYNNKFSTKERFIGSVEKDEGIFRALYYGVKGHNDSPKYVKEKYNQCIPANLITNLNNLDDLPNLYLKFQLDKLATGTTPLSKLVSMASFNQSTENLGIALYSTAVRPHLNSKIYYYTYFTSPMRRVVDTMVQTCLIANKDKCYQTIDLFKKYLLNRMDINCQVEKYNLYVSVCNKIFGKDNKGKFTTQYIKYGNDSFNNIFLPNLDITLSVPNKINQQLASEGYITLKFNQITEPFEFEIIPDQSNIITIEDIIQEQKQLYFKEERYPDKSSYNYLYLNYRITFE